MERYKKKDVLEFVEARLVSVIEDIKQKFNIGDLKAMSFLLEQCLAQCGVVVHNIIIKIKKG